MLQTIKLSGSNIWFFADAHLNHWTSEKWAVPLWKMRGYSSMQDHDESFVKNWNQHLNEESIVFSLGDFIMSDNSMEKTNAFLSRLRFGQFYNIPGNHNSGVSQLYHKSLAELYPEISSKGLEVYPLDVQINSMKKITFLPHYVEVKIGSTMLCLFHYSISSFNKMNSKGINSLSLGGHSHSSNPLTKANGGIGKRLDCDFGHFRRPISISEVKSILAARQPDIVDHHTENTY